MSRTIIQPPIAQADKRLALYITAIYLFLYPVRRAIKVIGTKLVYAIRRKEWPYEVTVPIIRRRGYELIVRLATQAGHVTFSFQHIKSGITLEILIVENDPDFLLSTIATPRMRETLTEKERQDIDLLGEYIAEWSTADERTPSIQQMTAVLRTIIAFIAGFQLLPRNP